MLYTKNIILFCLSRGSSIFLFFSIHLRLSLPPLISISVSSLSPHHQEHFFFSLFLLKDVRWVLWVVRVGGSGGFWWVSRWFSYVCEMLDIYIVSPLYNSINFYEWTLTKCTISLFFCFTSGRIMLKIMSLPCLLQRILFCLELQFYVSFGYSVYCSIN